MPTAASSGGALDPQPSIVPRPAFMRRALKRRGRGIISAAGPVAPQRRGSLRRQRLRRPQVGKQVADLLVVEGPE
jgi:hypothetical protein